MQIYIKNVLLTSQATIFFNALKWESHRQGGKFLADGFLMF